MRRPPCSRSAKGGARCASRAGSWGTPESPREDPRRASLPRRPDWPWCVACCSRPRVRRRGRRRGPDWSSCWSPVWRRSTASTHGRGRNVARPWRRRAGASRRRAPSTTGPSHPPTISARRPRATTDSRSRWRRRSASDGSGSPPAGTRRSRSSTGTPARRRSPRLAAASSSPTLRPGATGWWRRSGRATIRSPGCWSARSWEQGPSPSIPRRIVRRSPPVAKWRSS